MPVRLKLIYIFCCFIDAIAFLFNREWLAFLGALPTVCLLCFYSFRPKIEKRLKDHTYIIGLILAILADIIIELDGMEDTILAMILYMLSYSFYIAAVRKETSFSASSADMLKVMLCMLIIISPLLAILSKIPSDYHFPAMLYMVFLVLLFTSALLRKTDKSSYQWFLSGAICFVIVTHCKVYSLFVIQLPPYDNIVIKILYDLAQYATFVGIVKSIKNFYPATEK